MKISILRGGEALAEFDLDDGEYIVGSGDTANLRLESESVAALHARIRIGSGGAEVEDLGSGLGTLLGELTVAGVQPVPMGSMIQVGDLMLQIRDDASPRPPAEPTGEPGSADDRYVVGDVVAQGAMGVIRRAHEVATGRVVAMKQMHSQLDAGDPALAARFVQEAKITAHLEHPNVVPVHDVSPGANGSRFYTMKMVRGISLEKLLELLSHGNEATIGKYSLDALLTIFQKVCDALAFAHSKGVIHRDLKPANIMVGEYGEVLVMDWGVAKLLSESVEGLSSGIEAVAADARDSFATMAGTVVGTPYYMAPEQASGDVHFMDARSDVHALGAILYELLTLQTPVEGRDAREVLQNVREGKLIPPLLRVGAKPLPHLPGGKLSASLAAVAMKAMALSPERRYRCVPDLQADVRAFQTGRATGAEDAGAWRQFTLLVKRNKGVSTAIAACLVALAVLSAIFTAGVIRERNRANAEKDRAREGLAQVSVEKNRVTEALALIEPERQRATAERDRAEAESKAAKEAAAQINVEKKSAAEALAQVEPERQRADAERLRAEAETKNTKTALAKLRATAPTFMAQAQALIENQNAKEALEKLDFAVAVDPGNPAYLLSRAHLLEATLQWKQAAAAYRQVIALHPDPLATANLALCEKLLKENAEPAALPPQELQSLYQSIVAQQRPLDAIIFARLTGRTDVPVTAIFGARLNTWQSLPGWSALPERLGQRDGGYYLNLSGLPITDLKALTDLPIQSLDISGTRVTDLEPIRTLPLRELIVSRTPLTDLGPLHGSKITNLNIDSTKIIDLSPLAGVPLNSISMWETNVVNLAPLRGAQLKSFKAGHSNADSELRDISALQGMPLSYVCVKGAAVSDLSPVDNPNLTTLEFGHSTLPPGVQTLDGLKVSPLSERLDAELAFTLYSIEGLRGKPLTKVILTRCDRLLDVSPLADCPTITELHLPGGITPATAWGPSVRSLRKLHNLQRVAFYFDRLTSPAEFWRAYDQLKLK